MEQLDLVAKYLIVNEKVDGDVFKKLMTGEMYYDADAELEKYNAQKQLKQKPEQDENQATNI